MPRDTVAKTEGCTVTFTKLPDGKFKAMGGTSDPRGVFLADQVLEVRVRAGQLHFLRRVKGVSRPAPRMLSLAAR